MRIFDLGMAVTHPNYVGHTGTIISPDMTSSGYYKVLINNNHVMLHNEQLTEKNNMTEVETLEHRCFAVKAESDKLQKYMLDNGHIFGDWMALSKSLPAYATTKLTITEIRKDMFERYKQMFENNEVKNDIEETKAQETTVAETAQTTAKNVQADKNSIEHEHTESSRGTAKTSVSNITNDNPNPSMEKSPQVESTTKDSTAILSEMTIKLSIDGGTTARSQAAFAKIKELFIKSATAEIQAQLAKFEKLGVKCDFSIS